LIVKTKVYISLISFLNIKNLTKPTLLECRYAIQLTLPLSLFYEKPVSSFTFARLYAVFTNTGPDVI